MRLLFIKLKNIGDALIMTPALTAARELFPQAQIDVLVRGGTEGILKGSLAVNDIYTSAEPETHKRSGTQFLKDLALVWRLRKKKYDWIFELSDNTRGRIMAACIGGKNRVTMQIWAFPLWARLFLNRILPDKQGKVHRCEKDTELLRVFEDYKGRTPPMQFDKSFADWSWAQANVNQPPIVVHAATRWKRKMWTVERWQELVTKLSLVAPIVLTSGSSQDEVAMTREIAKAIPGRVTLTEGKLNWSQMAGLLYSSRMLVSVDTATMHLGAACQIPLVALFGPTVEQEWGPWACRHEVVVPAIPPSGIVGERRLTAVNVDEVLKACERMLAASATPKA